MAAANAKSPITPSTPLKREALARWNYVGFVDRFGWIPPEQYAALSTDLLQDMISILAIRDSKK